MSYSNPYNQAPQAEAGYGYSQPYDQQVSAVVSSPAPDVSGALPGIYGGGISQPWNFFAATTTTGASRCGELMDNGAHRQTGS